MKEKKEAIILKAILLVIVLVFVFTSCNPALQTYTVEFYDSNENLIESKLITEGDTLPAIQPPANSIPEGFRFEYWSTAIDGSSPISDQYQVNRDLKLYPVLTPIEFSIVLHDPDGQYWRDYSVAYGAKIPEDIWKDDGYPSLPGHVFLHWSIEPDGESIDRNAVIKEDVNLYPVYEKQTFTVTFFVGNELYKEIEVKYGDTIELPEPPESQGEGQEFAYWIYENSQDRFYEDTPIEGNITLVPLWADFHTITFKNGNDVVHTERFTVPVSLNDIAFEIPEEDYPDGKSFLGWSYEENGTIVSEYKLFSDDVELYAVWEDITYTVYFFDGNELWKEINISYGEKIPEPEETPAGLSGDKFKYWSTSRNGEPFDFSMEIKNPDNGLIQLYAVFGDYCMVTFIMQDGSSQNESVERGSIVNAPDTQIEGYVFNSWKDSEGNTVTFPMTVYGDCTVYGIWSRILTVSFDVNKPQDSTDNVESDKELSITVVENDDVNENQIPSLTLIGFTFSGWYENKECTIEANFSAISEDKTFFAKWEKNITISFVSLVKGQSTTLEATGLDGLNIEKDSVIEAPENAYLKGHAIEGYYSDEECQNRINMPVSFEDDTIIYVNWIPKTISITFSYDGATGYTDSSLDVEYGTTATMPTSDQYFVKEGYRAENKWFMESGKQFNFSIPVEEEEDFALHLNWVKMPDVTITFKITDSDTWKEISIPFASSLEELDEAPEKEYAIFEYWQELVDGHYVSVSFPLYAEENRTLVAKWTDLDIENFRYELTADGTGYVITDYIDYNEYLKEVIVPDTIEGQPVVKIGDSAFAHPETDYRHSIQTIILPDTITEIGSNAFYNQIYLKAVNIPDGITRIESTTFKNCRLLALDILGLNLPGTIEYIGKNAFENCISITTADLPEGLKEIDDQAFLNCSGLKKVSLPDSIEKIGSSVFSGMNELVVTGKIPDYETPSGVFSDIDNLTIMDSDRIGNFAFSATTFDDVSISNVDTIGESAFNSSSMKNLEIENVRVIEENAFSGIMGVEKISIPSSVKIVGARAFSSYALKEITVSWAEGEKPSGWADNWYNTSGNVTIHYGT